MHAFFVETDEDLQVVKRHSTLVEKIICGTQRSYNDLNIEFSDFIVYKLRSACDDTGRKNRLLIE